MDIPRKPRQLTSCNCSICRRYGTLWAYYKVSDVKVSAGRGASTSYAWGHRNLEFVRCATCGCVTHWKPLKAKQDSRMGVNARNLEPGACAGIRVRHLDGARSWKYFD